MVIKKGDFVFAAAFFALVLISFIATAGSFDVTASQSAIDEDKSYLFNFTVNNTDSVEDIAQVNITLNEMVISSEASGTSSNADNVQITTTTASWTNSTNELILSGSTHYFWFNATFANPGTYNFNITIMNASGAINLTNKTIIVFETFPTIQYGSTTTASGSYNSNTITAEVSASHADLSMINITLYNSNYALVNSSSNSSSPVSVVFATLAEGTYYLNATATKTNGNQSTLSQRTITLDRTNPRLTLISPTGSYETTDTTPTFQFNASDANTVANCTLLIDDVSKGVNTLITNYAVGELTSSSLSIDNYHWKIKCYDSAGNSNTSTQYDLTIASSSSSEEEEETAATSSEQAAGFWTSTYSANDVTFKAGLYNVSLATHERAKFKIGANYYYVGVVKLSSGAVTINASATSNSSAVPQQVIMVVNDVKKFDLTSDGFYDIQINMLKIAGGKANVTIIPINEKVPGVTSTASASATTTSATLETTSNTTTSGNESLLGRTTAVVFVTDIVKNKWFWIIFGASVLVLGGAGYYLIAVKHLLFKNGFRFKFW